MSMTLPRIRVGDPLRHRALAVFPLFSRPDGHVEYRLADEALADETLFAEEVDEGGSVPNLLVENKGDVRVLFLEGEELVGAKQNRVLNTSVLLAAHTKTTIPVSCVEQGRWDYKSRYFGSSGSHSPSKLRRALKASVSRSVRQHRGHASDQGAVWNEVACLDESHGVASGTTAMSDAFDTCSDQIASYRSKLKYVPGATGVAVAVGGQVVAIDVFDKPSTCEKVWDRMLAGVVLDALESPDDDPQASVADVEQLLRMAGDLPWEPVEAAGEGQEYRAESRQGDHASALSLNDTIIHGSVLTAV